VKAVIPVGGLGTRLAEEATMRFKRTTNSSIPAAELDTVELACFRHLGFWQAMDTVRDRTVMEGLWESGRAPWHTWA